VKASYTYIDGKLTDKSLGKDSSYYNLLRRPKNAIKLFAGYHITPELYVSTSLQVTGERTDVYYDQNFMPVQANLNAYTLWNAYAQYSFLKKRMNVFVDVKNITNNTNYYEVYGYTVQGTTLNAGFHFKL
jgi:vitamin B12 transporter